MALIKSSYPSTSTVAVTITLASLATGSAGVFTTGREGAAVVNTSNLDLDHIVRGKIRVGSGVTSGRFIQVFAFVPRSIASGTATWPDQCTGSDAARSFTSANVMNAIVRPIATIIIDATASRDYDFGGVSIASLFGQMPSTYGIYVAHDTGAALDATGSNHVIGYERIQGDVT